MAKWLRRSAGKSIPGGDKEKRKKQYIMINKWNFRTPTDEELHKRDRLAADLGISPVISLLLVQRGITSADEAKRFFKPSLSDLHDPFLMPDMEKAENRLNQTMGEKE